VTNRTRSFLPRKIRCITGRQPGLSAGILPPQQLRHH